MGVGASVGRVSGQPEPEVPQRPSTSAGSILTGALKHSRWLQRTNSRGRGGWEGDETIAQHNPGLEAIMDPIEAASGSHRRDRRSKRTTADRSSGGGDAEAPGRKKPTTERRGGAAAVAVISAMQLSAEDIDSREMDAERKRVLAPAAQSPRLKDALGLAAARAPVARLRAEVNVVVLHTPGLDVAEAEFRRLFALLDEIVEPSGFCVRCVNPLQGFNGDDEGFRSTALALALDTIASADIVVGVAGRTAGVPFPSTSSTDDEWQGDAWRRAVELHPGVAKLKGSSLFEIAAAAATVPSSGSKGPATVFCFCNGGGEGSSVDGGDEEDVTDILDAGLDERDARGSDALDELRRRLSKTAPVAQSASPAEAALTAAQHVAEYLRTLIGAKRALPTDVGLQARHAADQLSHLVRGDGTTDRIVQKSSSSARLTVVRGAPGVGKAVAATAAGDAIRQHLGGGAVLATHAVGLTHESTTLATILSHVLFQVAPAVAITDTHGHIENRTVPELLTTLEGALSHAGSGAGGGAVVVIPGVDLVRPDAYHMGDFAKVRLHGPATLTPGRCLQAVSTIFPGDVITKQNVDIKYRDVADPDALSTFYFDALVSGGGKATRKIVAGAVVGKSAVAYSHLSMSDERVAAQAYGLMLGSEEDEWEGRLRVVVDAVLDNSVAAKKGVCVGDVVVSVNGVSVEGMTPAEACGLIISSNFIDLVLETPASARRHTSSGDWLVLLASSAPPRVKFVVTTSDDAMCDRLVRALGKRSVGVVCAEGLHTASTESLARVHTAVGIGAKPPGTSGGGPAQAPSVLTDEQLVSVTEGRVDQTQDRWENPIHVVHGSGDKLMNGWYRRVRVGESSSVLARYVRRVQAPPDEVADCQRGGSHGVGGSSSNAVAVTTSLGKMYVMEYLMERLPEGKGWVLRTRTDTLYTCKLDTNDPPAVNWVQASDKAELPPPSVLNLDKMAGSRAASLALRTALAGVIPDRSAVPLVACVSGAHPDDVNGWYVASASAVALSHEGRPMAPVFTNANTTSGKVYEIHAQAGRWFLAEVRGGKRHNMFHNLNHSRDSLLPPVAGWGLVTEMGDLAAIKKAQVRYKPARLSDSNEVSAGGDEAAHQQQRQQELLLLQQEQEQQRQQQQQLWDSGEPASKLWQRADAIVKAKSLPTVRCMNPPVHLPLFVRMCCDQLRLPWHASGAERDRIVVDLAANFDLHNTVQTLLDTAEGITKGAGYPHFVQSCLLLVYFSRVGMQESELAELCQVEGGDGSAHWRGLFAVLRPVLISYAGRWSFRDPAVRELVGHRYLRHILRWAHASTQYSFFARQLADAGGDEEACPPRALEELANKERFDSSVFDSVQRIEANNGPDIELTGWALGYNHTLVEVDLSRNNITDRETRALADGLLANSVLERLSLADNAIDAEGGVEIARALAHNPKLTHLNLSGNRVRPEGGAAIAEALRTNRRLRTLLLCGNGLYCGGAISVAEMLKVNRTLTELSLADNMISTLGAEALGEALGHNPTLLRLNLSKNFVGSDGLELFAAGLEGPATKLTRLNLSRNGIDSAGMAGLAKMLRDNSHITCLTLSKNRIGDDGMAPFCGALVSDEIYRVNRKLQRLNLSDNEISDRGAKVLFQAIQQSKTLTDLLLGGNAIDPALVELIDEWTRVNRRIKTKTIVGR